MASRKSRSESFAADVDPATAGVAVGGYVCSPRRSPYQTGLDGDDAQGAQHRRPPDPGRLALPFLRGQPRARVRPSAAFGQQLDIPASTASASSRATKRRSRSCPIGGKQRVLRLQQPRRRADGGKADRRDEVQGRGAASKRGFTLRYEVEREAGDEPTEIAWQPSPEASMPACSARRSATRSGWATPSLYIEIERDLRGVYGDEIVYGGGKTLREGMGMDNQLTTPAGRLDLVITNVDDRRPDPRRGEGRRRHPGRQDRAASARPAIPARWTA